MSETPVEKLKAAERYALGLAKGLHAKHFPNNDEWQPLEGDLIGLLTQIDNMTTELVNRTRLKIAFRRALSDLPEIAPPEIRGLLSSVQMADVFVNEGKRLQRVHGLDAVAPRLEQECGAGAWSLMRNGVLAAKGETP
jgi:hypothetical protein